MDVYAAEHQLNSFLDRAAAKSGEARAGQYAANEEADRQRAQDVRRTHAVRLENAKEWASHYGGLALAHHDLAARCAQKRDETLALLRKLEAGHEGGTAA